MLISVIEKLNEFLYNNYLSNFVPKNDRIYCVLKNEEIFLYRAHFYSFGDIDEPNFYSVLDYVIRMYNHYVNTINITYKIQYGIDLKLKEFDYNYY